MPDKTEKPRGQTGLLIVGLALALMGGFFVFLLWGGYQKARTTRGWTETPCVVTESSVESFLPTPHSPVAFRFLVAYEYEVAGQRYTGNRFKAVDGPTNHEDRAKARLVDFPPGAATTCYVNPEDPSEALLKRGSKGPLYSIWFPALFVVGGLGIAAGALRRLVF